MLAPSSVGTAADDARQAPKERRRQVVLAPSSVVSKVGTAADDARQARRDQLVREPPELSVLARLPRPKVFRALLRPQDRARRALHPRPPLTDAAAGT